MEFTATGAMNGTAALSSDWQGVKAAVLAGLDVAAEFERLGVEFTRPGPNVKGIRECRAFGRRDDSPSAFVNVRSGVYHDSGGDLETLNLFDFALKYGNFGRWSDVLKFFAARAGVPFGTPPAGKGGRVREAVYLYHNADGSVAYAVFRYRLPNGKKTFSQHPPDGRGGWKYGEGCMDGVHPVPYRLPDLLATDPVEEPVWVVEGEKDADRLVSLGLTTTTNHQGSGATDRTWPHFVEHFRGREVFVLPDNDPAGRKHARKVAGYLHGVARSVKVVELPGLPPKGDVSDWLDLGHDLNELGHLAHHAPEWGPGAGTEEAGEKKGQKDGAGPEPETEPEVETIGASGRKYAFSLVVRGSTVRPLRIEWIWPLFIPCGFLTLFAGRTKVGKSFVTLDVVARLSRGGEIPLGSGLCFEPASSLIISEDPQEYVLIPRLLDAGADLDRVSFMTWEAMASFTLADTEMLDDTYQEAGSPRLIVIDPPTNFLGGKDEHKNAEVRGVLMGVSIWAMKHRAAVILITHCNKGTKKDMAAIDRIIGSIAWASTARIAHIFGPHPDRDGETVFLPLGSNIGKKVKGMSYQIVEENETVRVRWIGPVDLDADDMMAGKAKKPRGMAAVEWLVERFREQREWASDELKRAAEEAGISKNALWSPEARALPIRRRQIINAAGDRHWCWVAEDGWPPPAEANG